MKEIKLFPKINKANKQISFDLPKLKFSKSIRKKLTDIKCIKINIQNLEFERR